MTSPKDTAVAPALTIGHRDMETFWSAYADAPTVQTMMLSDEAHKWDVKDRDDIVNALPDLTGKTVVELGAGIGRFTGILARKAKHVLATDFIESFVDENRRQHGEMGNVTCQHTDAMHLEVAADSTDFVFTNWLLMYLPDTEIIQLLNRIMTWIRPGGLLHVRESCTEPSTKQPKKGSHNPTHYRHISEYITLLQNLRCYEEATSTAYAMDVLWAKSVPTYVEIKGNWRQVHMLVQKIALPAHHPGLDASPTDLETTLLQTRTQQNEWDLRLNAEEHLFGGCSPADSIFLRIVERHVGTSAAGSVVCFTPRELGCFQIAEKLNACVLGVTRDPLTYSSLLGMGNAHGDKRVRFYWTKIYQNDCHMPQLRFDVACGYNLLKGTDADGATILLTNIKKILKPAGKVVLLEQYAEENVPRQAFGHNGLSIDICENITSELAAATQILRNAKQTTDNANNAVKDDILNEWTNKLAEAPALTCIVASVHV